MSALPPGPSKLYLFKQILKLPREEPAQLAHRYGDLVTVPTLMGPIVMTVGPRGNEALFRLDTEALLPMVPDIGDILRHSVMFQTGDKHRRSRKLLRPPFHGARMRAYGEFMRAATHRHVPRWKDASTFTMLELTQAITFDVIIESVFGITDADEIQAFNETLTGVLDSFSPLLFVKALQRPILGRGPWDRYVARFKRFQEHVRRLVAERESGEGEDVLALLLSARDADGQGLDEAELMDQLLTMVIAGHETTSVSLAWAVYLLHRHPPILAKLLDELSTLASPDRPAPENIARLPYLKAICHETLRLYPPVHRLHRRLGRPMNLCGWDLDAGTAVGIGIYATHRQESIYPEPDAFRPERFIERSYSSYEFLPFGGGPRRCLGAAFALYEMQIVLATLLVHHRLELQEEGEVGLTRRAGNVFPKGGIRMRFR